MSLPPEIIQPFAFVDLNQNAQASDSQQDAPRIGYDAAGELPSVIAGDYDLLFTARMDAPYPWVCVAEIPPILRRIKSAVDANPVAANMLIRQLRRAEALPFMEALETESLAYSALLGGGEFARWLSARAGGDAGGAGDGAVDKFPDHMLNIERDVDDVTIILADPARRNAMTARMRDALFDVLTNMLDDPTLPEITITGAGKCFSTGGHLPEFGRSRDLSAAHMIRLARGAAPLIDQLGPRCQVIFHSACVGSGLEVFAAAHRRVARKGAWFQLPELSMGLIPGAGGTATVTRAIGRHRAAYMMLTGSRISAETALSWGLIERIIA